MTNATLIVIAGPEAEPVTAADEALRVSGRIDGTEFDAQLAVMLPALRAQAETITGRRFMEQTLEARLDAFPAGAIDLGVPDVTSIISVKYVDAAGAVQTCAPESYTLISGDIGSRVEPAYGTSWPAARAQSNAVLVRFKVGVADADDVPAAVKAWIITHAVQALRCPEGVQSGTLAPLPYVDNLLDGLIVWNAR